jgi:NADPH-dependent glutamate synthase beta subunit-like oxidoreductase
MDFMPPCNSACPAGENIQEWLAFAQAGHYREAFNSIVKYNPFPAVMGRVCVKPCETGCNRNHIDDTVNIHAVERFIGDLAIEQQWPLITERKPSGKRVMVVGAGPSGLSAAYHLRRLGHHVEIFEARGEPGGLMSHGIPPYRLPTAIWKAEVNRILSLGIALHVNFRVEDLLKLKVAGRFDAVYLGLGAYKPRTASIAGNAAIPVWQAMDFMEACYRASLPPIGNKVVIYGGNKLAMHLARLVRRLGAQPAILYPGDRKLMPAYDFEADDAISEGVEVNFLHNIKAIEGNQLTVEIMQMEKGKPIPSGEEVLVEADFLIIALGQEVDSSLYASLEGIQIAPDGGLKVNTERMTGCEGIFAGGDMLPGEQRSTTTAIGHGKKAAKYMDAWLRGETYQKPPKPQTASYKRLHMWFKTDAPQRAEEKVPPWKAVKTFEEVVAGMTEAEARYEAKRCLSCGNCFECDGCYGACPEDAIIILGKGNRYQFNYNKCTGCGICFEQCPCHAIEIIPEPVNASNDAGK